MFTTAARQDGLTLFELLIALAVVGIVVTLVVPSFRSSIARHELVAAAERVRSDLDFARSEAIKRSRPVLVSFQSDPDWCYALTTSSSPCDCQTESCQLEGRDRSVRGSSFPTVRMTSEFDEGTTAFDPRRGTTGMPGAVRLSNDAGAVTVRLSALGRPSICSDRVYRYPSC